MSNNQLFCSLVNQCDGRRGLGWCVCRVGSGDSECVCVCVLQAVDEPAYLTVGTDVSAKYRGAFCEAKIKTVKRLVKVKVRRPHLVPPPTLSLPLRAWSGGITCAEGTSGT